MAEDTEALEHHAAHFPNPSSALPRQRSDVSARSCSHDVPSFNPVLFRAPLPARPRPPFRACATQRCPMPHLGPFDRARAMHAGLRATARASARRSALPPTAGPGARSRTPGRVSNDNSGLWSPPSPTALRLSRFFAMSTACLLLSPKGRWPGAASVEAAKRLTVG
ncbi:hypothetical protein HIM_05914 [Hirsutella minnesotensis 3608]|uniref:Uncharacterized protein n=1 Tax=Hirsutella minnesotensis 3608 TaxID=1043627 RepID=A0A0F7ZZU8_9HYPO|nr:hypothetical protein HIM_05914 [Hirsutella minnesotensis 3608]